MITDEVEAELKGHTEQVRCVAFSHDGSQVVSGSDDNMVPHLLSGTSYTQ